MHNFPWWLHLIFSTDFLISVAVIVILLIGVALYYGYRYFQDDKEESE